MLPMTKSATADSDKMHKFRFGINDDKCHRCNLTLEQAAWVPCEPPKTFGDLIWELYQEIWRLEMNEYNQKFEEWREWFESHKEIDGTINIDKYPDFREWIIKWSGKKKYNFNNSSNSGDTINFYLVQNDE